MTDGLMNETTDDGEEPERQNGEVMNLREILDKGASKQDWVEIIRALVNAAKQGGAEGARAAEVLCRYRWGNPTSISDADGARDPAPVEWIRIEMQKSEREEEKEKRHRPQVARAKKNTNQGSTPIPAQTVE